MSAVDNSSGWIHPVSLANATPCQVLVSPLIGVPALGGPFHRVEGLVRSVQQPAAGNKNSGNACSNASTSSVWRNQPSGKQRKSVSAFVEKDFRHSVYNIAPVFLESYYWVGEKLGGLPTRQADFEAWGVPMKK
ncbi:hypothetical protein C0Q70_14260 [Pomacea canaliculata]|uniref:Uncharacterized protein n=1 Tax=Pomacea canaliculata TaxID=400727 RepID=A0A2T7NZL3_POMCA|nr:hypothetical protein C0Q70_14260 [Pomacea canaliculata]